MLIWLLALFFDLGREEKYEKDFFFAHRAWVEGRMADKEFRRYGDMARRYINERDERQAFLNTRWQAAYFDGVGQEPFFEPVFNNQPAYAQGPPTLYLPAPVLQLEHAKLPSAHGFRSRPFC
jgi:hypothetical protein